MKTEVKKAGKKDTETEILKAAKKIFIAKGYDGARMQEIANEANINKAMLHYYFRSKDALFGKIMEEAVHIMADTLIPSFTNEGSVMEKLERIVTNYIDVVSKNPHIPLFVLSEMSRGQALFQNQLKSKMMENGTMPAFFHQIIEEQQQGKLVAIPPQHLILTVMSLIAFPFIAKAVFIEMLDIPEQSYTAMMEERKAIVMDILKKSFLIN